MKKTLLVILLGCFSITLFYNAKQQGRNTEVVVAPTVSTALPDTQRVLFIGNSFTGGYTEDIPLLFKNMADSNAVLYKLHSSIKLGQSLSQNANSTPASTYLNTNKYNYIVLQENSTNSTQAGGAAYLLAVQAIAQKAKTQNPNVKIILYQIADPQNGQTNQSVINTNNTNLQSVLTASGYSVVIVPVGEAMLAAYSGEAGYNHIPSGTDLLRFPQNQYHLNSDGAFLAALQIYHSIFPTSVHALKIPSKMQFDDGTNWTFAVTANKVSNINAIISVAYNHPVK